MQLWVDMHATTQEDQVRSLAMDMSDISNSTRRIFAKEFLSDISIIIMHDTIYSLKHEGEHWVLLEHLWSDKVRKNFNANHSRDKPCPERFDKFSETSWGHVKEEREGKGGGTVAAPQDAQAPQVGDIAGSEGQQGAEPNTEPIPVVDLLTDESSSDDFVARPALGRDSQSFHVPYSVQETGIQLPYGEITTSVRKALKVLEEEMKSHFAMYMCDFKELIDVHALSRGHPVEMGTDSLFYRTLLITSDSQGT